MSISVREAESVEEFLHSWKKVMQHTLWFRERRLFDYNPGEIIEDVKQAFRRIL